MTLADTLVGGYDLVELMHYLVDVSVELSTPPQPGLCWPTVTGSLDVLASTSERTELLEVLQIRTGRGPCHDCYTTGEAADHP